MGGGLVRDDVDLGTSPEHIGNDLRSVSQHADRQWPPGVAGLVGKPERLVHGRRLEVEVAVLDAAFDAGQVALDDDRDAAVHRDGEAAPRPFRPARRWERDRPGEGPGEPLRRHGGERLVCPLQNSWVPM